MMIFEVGASNPSSCTSRARAAMTPVQVASRTCASISIHSSWQHLANRTTLHYHARHGVDQPRRRTGPVGGTRYRLPSPVEHLFRKDHDRHDHH